MSGGSGRETSGGRSQTGSQGPQMGGDDNSAEGGAGMGSDSKREGDYEESDRDGENVADIPEDIPVDGSGEDVIARQIREAAMTEQDPEIRAALWEEYRKHMGIN